MARGTRHSKQDRTVALTAYVLAHENSEQASRDLAASGELEVRGSTIREWLKKYPDELAEVQTQVAPRLEEEQAKRLDRVAVAAVDVLAEQIERAKATVGDLTARDLPGAARNSATVAAILTDKSFMLRQKPTVFVQHDYETGIKKLQRMGLVEGEAEEITDAELVAEN